MCADLDLFDLYTAMILSLSERWTDWRFMLAFALSAAVQRIQALQLVQIEREPAEGGDNLLSLSQTKTLFVMSPQTAERVCQAFVDAALLAKLPHEQDDVYLPTPKGLHVVDRFVTRHGVATDAATNLLSMHPVCDKLLYLERDDQDDVFLSDAVVRIVFQRMVGLSPHRIEDSSLGMTQGPEQQLADEYGLFKTVSFDAGHALNWLLHYTSLVSTEEASTLAAHMVRLGWIESNGTLGPDLSSCVSTVRVDTPEGAQYGTFVYGDTYHVTRLGTLIAWHGEPKAESEQEEQGASASAGSKARAQPAPGPTPASAPAPAPEPTPAAAAPRNNFPLPEKKLIEARPPLSQSSESSPRASAASCTKSSPTTAAPASETPMGSARDSYMSRPGAPAEPTVADVFGGLKVSDPAPSSSTPATPANRAALATTATPAASTPVNARAPRMNNITTLAQILHNSAKRKSYLAYLDAHSTSAPLHFWCEIERFRSKCRLASNGLLGDSDDESSDAINDMSTVFAAGHGGPADTPRRRAAQRPLLSRNALRLEMFLAPGSEAELGLSEELVTELKLALAHYAKREYSIPGRLAHIQPENVSADAARESETQLAKLLLVCSRAQKEVFKYLASERLDSFLESYGR